MSDVFDFFNSNKPIVRKVISGGTTNGRLTYEEPKTSSNRSNEFPSSSQYADAQRAENQQQLMNSIVRIEELNLNDCTDNENSRCDNTEIYSNYNFDRPTTVYPITSYKDRILNAIKQSSFVVLEGPTACGKTTQVPQFILDEAYRENKNCNIVIAQPRRIAAASNAERVSGERNWPLGTVVGYQIGFDEKKHLSNDTRILFCTTGILLEKLIKFKHFHNYTHIILDEVHERNKDMDFLFVVIKKLFVSVVPMPKVKIIIMSATIEASRFSEYFAFPKQGILQSAPIISIEQKSKFRVKEFYLNEFYQAAPKIQYNSIVKTNPSIPVVLYKIALHLINRFDDIDKKEATDEIECDERPTVLVFLPGMHEIIQLETIFKDEWNSVNSHRTRIDIIVLHSTSDSHQRSLAFSRAAPKTRKIILATNIAESSITVPDVKYVLDFCRARIMVTDTLTNFSALQLCWAARSSCKQRAGRTGRVMNGRCYRFVEKQFYEDVMLENAIPELVSSPLENVILKAKLLEMGSPAAILALAMDHPQLNDIANTILVLKEIGALLRTCNGEPSDMDGDISFIGRIMANLPIDVKIAKFIILGYCFSILDECIIIGAALNSRSIFRDAHRARESMTLYSQQLRWANSSGSDLFAMLHAYNAWTYLHSHCFFGVAKTRTERARIKQAERNWADQFCLDIDALQECHVQINEIKCRLERMKIKPGQGVNSIQWDENQKSIILKVVIAGAFYPNFFARVSCDSDDHTNAAFQSIGTRDPKNTVYYTGFDREHARFLYKKAIKNIFIEHKIVPIEFEQNIKVSFDVGSNKAFVTFKNDGNASYRFENGTELMPGKVRTEVYKSLKMRSLKIPTEFWIMKSRSDEIDYAEKNGISLPAEESHPMNTKMDFEALCLPRILDVKMNGLITNIESCNRFWFQPENEVNKVFEFEMYVRNYRTKVIEPISMAEQLIVGKMVIARIETCDSFTYCRAKIMSGNMTNGVCRIRLIDTGKILDCDIQTIYEYCGKQRNFIDLPPRCFECSLAQLQPSQIRYTNGFWPSEAMTLFEKLTAQRTVTIEVYSVTNGKANVFVECPETKESLNDILIREQFGEFVEEDYISNYNHLMRETQHKCQLSGKYDNFVDPMCRDYFIEENATEVEPPPMSICRSKVKLNGPFSSLSIEPRGLTEATRNSKVLIDRHSINSVMLENDPQDMIEKYLIASTVCYTDSSKRNISLRYTTQMPNIRGFGPLMALIFCPTMHVKCNEEKTHYTALRTGLGYDNVKKRPVFEEHDIVFKLNVEITQHDIELVNQIRYCLDTLLLTYPGEEESRHLNDQSKREILHKIKNVIVKLLERPRQCINTDSTPFDWDENFSNSPNFVKSIANDIYGNRAIFPMHCTLKTQSRFDTNREFMHLHCNQLHDLTEIVTTFPRPVLCKLCNTKLEDIGTLKMHLLTGLHCDNEKRINYKR